MFMSQYFDKDFFKFLIGFVAIIIISLTVVALLRNYQAKEVEKSPVNNIATPQS